MNSTKPLRSDGRTGRRVARAFAGLVAITAVSLPCLCRAGSPTPTGVDVDRPERADDPTPDVPTGDAGVEDAPPEVSLSTAVSPDEARIDPLGDARPPSKPKSAWKAFKRTMRGEGVGAQSSFDRMNAANMGGRLTSLRTRGRWVAGDQDTGVAVRLRRSIDPVVVHDTPMKYLEGGVWAVWQTRPAELFDFTVGFFGGVNRVKWWDRRASDSESTWGLVVAPEARVEYGLTEHLRIGLALTYRMTAAFGEMPDDCRNSVDGLSGTVLLDVIDF